MTHRRDFKTIFEVSECITDSTLFQGYDLAVVMNKNEKMKKKKSKAGRERGCLQFPNLLPCTSCRDFLWYLNELLASNKIRGTRRRGPTTQIFLLPWHYLHSLNKMLVKAIRTKRERESHILWV